jgi:Protein of unknown function (DUF3160)
VVAVALSLLDPAYVVSPDLAVNVTGEAAFVRAHAGLASSPLLGATLDYGAMTPRGPIQRYDDPRTPLFEAAEWLAEAPFSFVGKAEAQGREIDVGAARSQTRAALMLARMLLKTGDGPATAAFERMTAIDRFVLGDAEDLSPADVAETARLAGLDLPGGADIADTSKLDHFRHLAAPRSMRLVPLRAPPDVLALQQTVAKDGRMHSGDDIATWLGSLTPKDEKHASVYVSLLGAMASILRTPSDKPAHAANEREQEVRAALVAWTFLRHDALAFAHDAPTGPAPLPAAKVVAPFPRGHIAPVYVPARPEAIGSLLGAVRQLRAGLFDLRAIEPDGSSSVILAEVESILSLLFAACQLEPSDELGVALAEVPARIAALEAWAGPAANPVVIDVHVDRASGRVLEEGTGPLDELFTLVRDPGTHRLVLAVGAAIPRVEREESVGRRWNDASWRSKIDEGLLFAGLPE